MPQKSNLCKVIEENLSRVILCGLPRQQFNANLGKTIVQKYNVAENSSIEMDVSLR
jgi:hypothetical protein